VQRAPKVSIIILNWNGFDDTKECIESLLKVGYENYSVIVVDNGSRGNDAEKLREFFNGKITVLETGKNLGFAGGVNVGIRYALKNYNPDYILLLNNDTIVGKNFLRILVKALETKEEYGIAGPKIYYYDAPQKIWYAGGRLTTYLIHFHIGEGKYDAEKYNKPYITDFVTGACMLIKRKVIEKIGLLDTVYFLGWEDIDYCIRAKKVGFKCLYVPYSVIWHKVSSSYKKHGISYAQLYYGYRNRLVFRAKHLTLPAFIIYLYFYIFQFFINVFYYMIIYQYELIKVASVFKGAYDGLKLSIKILKQKTLHC